jgi:benzodiazapine receptor
MTTYIPSLTLPSEVFLNPAASVLLPVALGATMGISTSRKESSAHEPSRLWSAPTDRNDL